MPKFKRSKGRESRGRDDRSPRRDSRSGGSFEEYSRGKRESGGGRDSRGGRDFGRERRPSLEMTKVICSECNSECEVPFKPTSSKPVYCRDCFDKKGGNEHRDRNDRPPRRFDSSGNDSNNSRNDFEIINKKLDKIMKTLNID